MATIIIHVDGGIVNEVYSTMQEPLSVRVYESDDVHDEEHAHQFASCSYAAAFANLRPSMENMLASYVQIFLPLKRRPESKALVAEQNKAKTGHGAADQALDAAFAAGYLEAIGDERAYIEDRLQSGDSDTREAMRAFDRLLDQQLEKYFAFCETINRPDKYDSGEVSE